MSSKAVASCLQPQVPAKIKNPLVDNKRRKKNVMQKIYTTSPLIFCNYNITLEPQVSIPLTLSYASCSQKNVRVTR